MTEEENDDFLVEIEKDKDGTKIRISGIGRNEFDSAYRLAVQLTGRVKELDVEIAQEHRFQEMVRKTESLWSQNESTWTLDASISDASRRIALALLKMYPECLKQVDVANMTGIPKKTVSNHLSGKVDSTRDYFDRCAQGHRLSEAGLQWLADKIVPLISSDMDKPQEEGA